MVHASAYEGLIFDYGGVLVAHQTERERAAMAATAKLPQSSFDQHYWGERTAYDRGDISGGQYWSNIARAAGTTFTQEQIEELTEADTVSWMNYDSMMWDWIVELRGAGKKVAMLSNMPLDLGVALKSRTDKLTVFDHVTLSYELHSVKPDPVIYEECLEGIGTSAEKTLFLDDRLENVTGAEHLGIHGVQFTSRDEVLLRLRS